MSHFDRYKILTDSQHGFRAKSLCESQLITTIQKIVSTMSSKGQVDAILLDLAKAFDKVPHQRLLHKLEFYGVCNSTLCWIVISPPQEKVGPLDGTNSSEADVLSGVPQGMVLVPFLFLAFINDLPDVTKQADARLFADNCLLYRHISSIQDSALLQQDLSANNLANAVLPSKMYCHQDQPKQTATNQYQLPDTRPYPGSGGQ